MDLANVNAIEDALHTVQRVLDVLGAQGQNETAFRLARAQFAASVRTSWPGNLSGLVKPLESILADTGVQLEAQDRASLTRAIETLRAVQHA
jgi:hypothetical protein